MSDIHWGVDSLTPANTVLRTDKVTKKEITLFDIVTERAGRMPAFWGRYLDGHGKSNLSLKEAQDVFRMSNGATRILPIYLPAKVSVGLSKQQGENDAANASKLAAKIGVPPGTFLWADIEPDWLTSENWLRGWWEGMFRSQYGGRGGIYEDPRESNGASFAWPYFNALTSGSDWRDYGQVARPATTRLIENTLPERVSAPGRPRYHDDISTYHTSNLTYQEENPQPKPLKINRKAPPFPEVDMPATARLLWSQRPVKVGGEDLKTIPAFNPTRPLRVENTTVVWQYAIDCMKLGGKIGFVDLDLATTEGLNVMWSSAD